MNHRINDALVAWLLLPVAEQERAASVLLDAIERRPSDASQGVIAF